MSRFSAYYNVYLETKNRLVNDVNSPSFVCYKIAVEEVYQKIASVKKTQNKQKVKKVKQKSAYKPQFYGDNEED